VTPKQPEPRYSVSLVVIARDEAQQIARLLLSLKPWVDEMLVLDTGSSDATVRIAREAGARVEHFSWCDDFSAARNAALDLSTADWHVALDADEWLINGGEALRDLRHTAPDHVGAIQLADHFSDGQTRLANAWLSRVLPGAVRYAGRIHEQPQHTLPLRRLPVLIGHDGYLPAQLKRKQGRNRKLLEAALAQTPSDPYLWYQLGKDASVYDDYEAAEAAFARAVELQPSHPAWWLDLVARRLFALKQLKRHQDGIDFAQTQMTACEASPDFYFALADLLLDLAADHPQLAEELLPMVESALRRCLEIGECPELSGAVAGRGSHLAAHNLALVLEGTGRADEARTLRQAYR